MHIVGGVDMERKLEEQYIFNSIFMLSNKLQLAGDSLCGDITLKQFLLLIIVKTWAEGSPNMNDLAAMMGCSRQNIKNIILSLEKKKFIKVKENTKDKRSTSIVLTKKSRGYLEEHEKQFDNILDELFKDVDENEVIHMCNLIDKLYDNVNWLITNNVQIEYKYIFKAVYLKGKLLLFIGLTIVNLKSYNGLRKVYKNDDFENFAKYTCIHR